MENQNTPANVPQDKNTPMGILAYLGPLVIVSYLVAKEEPFVKFHIKQGLVLLVIEVAIRILAPMFGSMYSLFNLLDLTVLVFIVIGIVNVVKGDEKELPFIGQFSKHFPI